MKNLCALALMGIFIANLAGCVKSCRQSEEQKVLRIGTNANFPPYETIDKQGGLIGLDIDLGRALAEELGLKAQFKEFDFDALILALKKGQIDIIMSGLSITKSRQNEIDLIPYQGKPMTDLSLLFWEEVPQKVANLDDLKRFVQEKKMAISVQSGHFLEGFLREEGINVKPLAGPPEQILDIKYKKSLAAALDGANARNLLSKHPGLKLLSLSLPEDKWDLGLGIGVKKGNTELFQKIQEAVTKLRSNGVIEALEKKWIQDAS